MRVCCLYHPSHHPSSRQILGRPCELTPDCCCQCSGCHEGSRVHYLHICSYSWSYLQSHCLVGLISYQSLHIFISCYCLQSSMGKFYEKKIYHLIFSGRQYIIDFLHQRVPTLSIARSFYIKIESTSILKLPTFQFP